MASDPSVIKSLSCYVCSLDARKAFNSLSCREKLYAHYMARAAWHGSRIIMRQVSSESRPIFDFILETHLACEGNWEQLAQQVGISDEAIEAYLEYAAVFLANIGNYYGRGDQKIIPAISPAELEKISNVSERAKAFYEEFKSDIFSQPPYNLGFPSDVAQSAYYVSDHQISSEDIDKVSKLVAQNGLYLENTRLQKQSNGQKPEFLVLQASIEEDNAPVTLHSDEDYQISLKRGDHAVEFRKIYGCLENASSHAANAMQRDMISKLMQSFKTGDIEAYRDSQRLWIKDKNPAVETILGFVEPYRDPYGVRAEFEGLVGIVDPEETKVLTALTQQSMEFIRRLPWTQGYNENENRGMGPFEKDLFEPPDFTSLQVLTYCSSIIFLGINLPNFNDIRQTDGFKNVMISNRHKLIMNPPGTSLVDASELETFNAHKLAAWRIQITIHELFGHGTSRLLMEEESGKFNFDRENLPINPLTKKPITTWYRPGETWTGVFGGLATTLDECRAECVGSYLTLDKELLTLFGYTDKSEITADDLIYNLYLNLGVIGLRSLENYIMEDKKWGQAHDRAHFAMLRALLDAGDDFMTITHEVESESLTVRVDRSKIFSHGRVAIGDLLLKLHIYRCTADIDACRAFYEELTRVDGVFLVYRDLILSKRTYREIFVQANTVLVDGDVQLRDYEPTARGMVQSWVERGV